MLNPHHGSSLQRRRMVFEHPWQAWGRAWLLNLLGMASLWLAAWGLQQAGWLPTSGIVLAAGIAIGWLALLLLVRSPLTQLQPMAGQNPGANQQAIRQWAKDAQLLLSEDRPDYLLLLQPGLWYQRPLQICFLLQGRDMWVHAATLNKTFRCLAPLGYLRAQQYQRRAALAVSARLVADQRDWEK